MNKIFKTIWNSVRRCLVVVNEATKTAAQRGSTRGAVVDESHSATGFTTDKHFNRTFLLMPLVLCSTLAQADFIVYQGENKTLEGTADSPGYTIYWRDVDNYGTLTVKGVSSGFGIQDAKGGHWRNHGVMYVYDYGINNSRNNEHDNNGILHLMTENALFSSGFRNHGSAKVYSVTKALLRINERTRPVTDTTYFKALHNRSKIDVGLGTGHVRNVKEITGVTGIKFTDMTFDSSNNGLIFTDVVAGTASAQAILTTLKGHAQYAKPQVSFTGSGVNAYGANGLTFTELNLDAARDAKNKGYAGAIFYNDALKLGGATKYLSDIGSNMGFKSIDGTMNVNQGLVLTLSGASGAGYLMSGNTAVMENGVLTLGNSQLSSGGKLKVVNLNNGALAVDAGTFSVDGLKATNNAVVTVANGSTLNVAGLGGTFNTWLVEGNAHLKNGSLTIRGLSGNGLFSNDGAQLTLNADAIGMNIKNAGALALGSGLLSKAITNTGYVTTQNALHFGSDGRYSQSAGTLTTQQDSFFENVNFSEDNPLKTIGLSATIPEEIKTTLTEHFQKYVPGNVTQEIIDHAAFTGGKVVIPGVNLTTTMRDDLSQAFKDAFGEATEIVFEGTIAGVSANDVLNTATVNELADKHVLNDVIFVDRALEGENQSVVIGDAGVKNSTGFTSINDAKDVTIRDGKNLVLIGSKAAGFSLTDATVTASGDGSKLTLGTLGLADGADYQGQLNELILRGGAALDVVNGSYTVADLTARDSTTTRIDVRDAAKLTADSVALMSGSTLKNEGTLHITDRLEGLSDAIIENAEGAQMMVDGKTSIIGRLTNNGTLTARDEVSVNGTLTNNGDATIGYFKVLGAVNNTGTINTSETSFVNGQLTNTGTIKLYNTTNIDQFSELTNVKDLTAEGTVTMNGTLGNLNNADFEKLTVSGKDSELANHGTLVIDELTLTDGAHAINGGAVKEKYALFGLMRSPRTTEQIRELNVSNGTQKTNAGLGFYGQGTIDGIFTNTNTAESTFGMSDVFVDGQGIAVGTTGQIQNAGTVTFGGSLVNAGSITGDGKIVFMRNGASTNVFSNAGTINVGSLEANNITYEHTGGSIASANGWFENSQINVKGDDMTNTLLGSGNTYTVGLTGSSNHVATLTIDTVTSDSDVNIIDGGKFVARNIALTEDRKTVHLAGGTLSTTLNQIFDDVSYKTLDIDADNPDDLVDIEGVKVATGVSGVIDSVQKGIEFGWGTVAFDDASYSASMATDVLNKLDAVDTDPTGHEGQLEVAFNGKAAQSFNVDLANGVVAKGPTGALTYATFANEELTNVVAATTDYTALFVGHSDTSSPVTQPMGTDFNNLHTSIGFKGVRNVADGLYIGDGYHFVLVGEDSTKTDAQNYELADGTVYVTGGANGGALGDPSTLTLGSYGTTNKTAGHLNALYVGVSVADLDSAHANGQVRVRHGDFTVDTLTNGGVVLVGGDGSNGLREDRDATLTVKNYIDNGYYSLDGQRTTNYAHLNIENLAMGNGKSQGSLVNKGTMTISNGTYNGELDNYAMLNVGTFTVENGAVGAQVGRYALNNHENATMVADNLTIAGDGTWGSGAAMRGGMDNAGTLTVNDNMNVDGTFENTGTVALNVFNVNDGAIINNKAEGSMTIDALAFNGGAFTNAGTVILAQTGADSTIASTFTNTGFLNVLANDHSVKLVTNGSIINDGTITANGKVSVEGGQLVNNEKATFTDLDITSGQVVANTDSTLKVDGTMTINMAQNNDIAIDNKTDLQLNVLDLTKGTIGGGTMHAADATVAASGVIDQIKGYFDKLVNAGSVNLTGGNVDSLENTGTLTSSGDITLAGTNAGTITVDAELGIDTNKTLTSTGTLVANGSTTIKGTFNAHGDTTLVGNTSIVESGKLDAKGTFNAATVNVAQGGTIASSSTSNIDVLNGSAGSTINVNGGSLHLGDLNATEVTYNQTDGTIMSDKGWFKDSVLNISGGYLDANQIKDDEGNVTGSLGHNTVNISGRHPMPSINNEDTPENKSHWKDWN